MFFRRLNACLCIVIGIVLIDESGQIRAESEVLSTKDGDSDRIVAVLQELVNGAITHELRRGVSYEMTGVIEPGNRAFHYVQQGDQAKFEVDWNSPNGNVKCYRVDDGMQFLKLDATSLTIHSIKDRSHQWNSLCDELNRFSAPLFEDRNMCLSERCQWIIDCVQGTGSPETIEIGKAIDAGAGSFHVKVDEIGKKVTIDLQDNIAPRNPAFSMEISRDKGYSLSKWTERDGNNDPSKWVYQCEIANEYREIEPSVWFLSTGERRISESGSFSASRGGPIERIERVEVTDVHFTDEDSYQDFTIDSLPVPKGAIVEDHRLEPSVSFIYNEGGVEESLLKVRLRSRLKKRLLSPPE